MWDLPQVLTLQLDPSREKEDTNEKNISNER